MRGVQHNKLSLSRRWSYRLIRFSAKLFLSPINVGESDFDEKTVFVLRTRSLTDLALLDISTEINNKFGPFDSLSLSEHHREKSRFFFLERTEGIFQRYTMQSYSKRLLRLIAASQEFSPSNLALVPVSIFWGRLAAKERSLIRSIFSERRGISFGIRRFVSFFFNRKDIVIHYGSPIYWQSLQLRADTANRDIRKITRLLRSQFKREHHSVLGPTLPHRPTLIRHITSSKLVTNTIAEAEGHKNRLLKHAKQSANSITSSMSYPSIRFMEVLLSWFWKRVYDGVDLYNLSRTVELTKTHTIIYTPSHKSHVDYLVLSHALFHNGLMLPLVAAGNNLDMPLIGPLLRRGGAFFLRRTFRDDPIYQTVFSEYLYRIFREGHSVEYFIEGGRSRTGKLRRPSMGMLSMSVESQSRELRRPLAIMPVYVGYERLIESDAYISELKGESKKKESILDVVRNLRLIGKKLGRVSLSFGHPIELQKYFLDSTNSNEVWRNRIGELGRDVLHSINACAHVNSANLIALAMPEDTNKPLSESTFKERITNTKNLILADKKNHDFLLTDDTAEEIVSNGETLGLIQRSISGDGYQISIDPKAAPILPWYRNNSIHVIATPALIINLLINRKKPIPVTTITELSGAILPFVCREFSFATKTDDITRWIHHLTDLGFLKKHRGFIQINTQNETAIHFISVLSKNISPVLNQFYITIAVMLHAKRKILRTQVVTASRVILKKFLSLTGIATLESFYSDIFDDLLEGMIDGNVVSIDEHNLTIVDREITYLFFKTRSSIDARLRTLVRQSLT